MEKRKPHCPLSVVHALVEQGQVRATMTALGGAAAMDFEFDDMLDVIRALTIKDFHKSMTSPRIADGPITASGRMCISQARRRGMSI